MAELELSWDGGGPPSPPDAIADVTEDDRFSGGRLASLDGPKAEDFLKMVATLVEDHLRE